MPGSIFSSHLRLETRPSHVHLSMSSANPSMSLTPTMACGWSNPISTTTVIVLCPLSTLTPSSVHAAHLLPVFCGDVTVPRKINFSHTLDIFTAFYVNKYIDYHVLNGRSASRITEQLGTAHKRPDGPDHRMIRWVDLTWSVRHHRYHQ